MWTAAMAVAGALAVGLGEAEGSKVMGMGSHEVQAMPSALRATVRLQAAADTLEKALADIQGQLDSTRTKLLALGPVKDTLVVRGPTSGSALSYEERMRRMYMGGPSRFTSTTRQAKEEVTLSAQISADWELKAGDQVALLRETDGLQTAITKALPPPEPKKEKPASEEEEERALMRMAGSEGEEAAGPGKPVFGYVARITAAQVEKARAEAFADAKKQAEGLAKAAGCRLGALKSVSGSVSSRGLSADVDYEEMMTRTLFMGTMGMAGPTEADPTRTGVVVEIAEPVVFTVGVVAAFEVKPAE